MLVRDEPAASIVAEALEGYASGRFETQSEVQRWLATRPEYPEVKRRNLTRERIREMLSRVVYAGFLTVPDWDLHLVPGKHEPLISFETYQRIQDRMAGRAKVPARKDLNLDFPLRGFINCVCGKTAYGLLVHVANVGNAMPIIYASTRVAKFTASRSGAMFSKATLKLCLRN